MNDILIAIDNTLHIIAEKNREEFRRVAIKLASLRLERGDSIESIISFIEGA
jgi:hypothetical protein